jgi:hypothetical protein
MAARSTTFPGGARMRVFRAVEAILKEDPALADRVKTWSSWDGEGGDQMPTASGMLPYLQLSPVVQDTNTWGVEAVAVNFAIRVRIAVPGLVAEDIINYWDAVEDALVRRKPFRDTDVLCYLASQGCDFHVLSRPGFGAWESAKHPPDKYLEGDGLLLLKIRKRA